MEELEDEADLLAAQPGERVFIEPGDVGAADCDRSARRRIKSGDEPQQRGLAAARRTDDREALPVGDIEIEGMKNGQRLAAAHHGLADAAKLNHGGLRLGPEGLRDGPSSFGRRSAGSSSFHTSSATISAPRVFG